MPVEILMPKLGLTMTEGKVIEWRKSEGDRVTKGEVIYVLETEKVAYEVEAPEDGIIGRILVAKDKTVPVGAIVAYLTKPGESADAIPAKTVVAKKVAPAKEKAGQSPPVEAARSGTPTGGRLRATPLAKKMARELNVNLSFVPGTGPSGRVVADDIKKAAASSPAAQAATRLPEKLVPFTGMRQTIAKNMMASKVGTAQTYMSVTVDASAIVKHRKALLPHIEEKHGVKLTITDLMMKLTGHAIMSHPVINTRWSDEGVHFLPVVHMGMAMALDEGLIVPVIRNINALTRGQIAKERTLLIEKVRENRFGPDDIKGSTFTLSTLGMFGIESFTANINIPESAILAVGTIIDKPVAVDGQVMIRPMMNMTLTYDHRIIDGAEAAKFMQTLKALIEEPLMLLV